MSPVIAAIGYQRLRTSPESLLTSATTIVWDLESEEPVVEHNAIVWQDRRTSSMAPVESQRGNRRSIREKTGRDHRRLLQRQ